MKAQIKLLITASIATLGVSTFANASINTSMEMVCHNAHASTLKTERKLSEETVNSSTLMSQHFAVTSCNGKQLLLSTKLENTGISSKKSNDEQLVSSAD
ncbi:hypothetical protein Q4574_08820 [Aliiglaciecola sp. 3_MG-2023]|uniref:hypothetical protein n=1 Tax=Aliiglaciecola sp. 3_MG-2023 TaxID=3062644 RepID=UPI0026E3E7AA|nr:hypothetical protein [Aliiglaciecola sp. 3_MG-2023]MDO6693386.1 hypothetical protein [Aliiglaciecola sp. 3_MG-2023]